MPTHYRLQIEIDETTPPDGALALIVPVPPTTPHQALSKIRLPASWTASQVTDRTGVQRAMLVELPAGTHKSPIAFEMVDCGGLDPDHLTKFEHTIDLTADVLALADEMGLLERECERDRLSKIVDALAAKFQYRSGFTNHSPLTCDILTGNCLSINEAFLKLAKVAGIPSAYYIGYFFECDQPLRSKDWHCWVSTLTSQGFESWDIAHHLKRGLGGIRPALNPVPGTRFATCVGRQLTFSLPVGEMTMPHLCEPRWILDNGTSTPCQIVISLQLLAEASGRTTDIAAIDRHHANREIEELAV